MRELEGDVLGRRRMTRQVGEHGAALLDIRVCIRLAEHGLGDANVGFDPGHDEAAWAKNRRAHFLVKQ